jgi:hypothetical protein
MSVFLQNPKAFLQNIKALLQNIKVFLHIAHDGTLHLANQPKILFPKKYKLGAATQAEPTFSPKTQNAPTGHRNISIGPGPEN